MKKPLVVQWLEFIPIRILLFFFQILPVKSSRLIGPWIGRAVYRLIPGLRRTAMNGLTLAFSSLKTPQELESLCRENFEYMGKFFLEFMQLPKMLKNKRIHQMVHFHETKRLLEEALKEGKGVIILTGHLNNWEYMGAAASLDGVPSAVIYRPLDNPLLDKYVSEFRTMFGAEVIPKQEVVKRGLKALRNGKCLTFVFDQNSVSYPVFVPFFGKLAATAQGPALFAYRTKAPVVLAYNHRLEDDTHEVLFERMPIDYSIEDKEQFIFHHTALFTKRMEEIIATYPTQWWWVHPRWNTRPPWEEQGKNAVKVNNPENN